jgi:hypothetical protein
MKKSTLWDIISGIFALYFAITFLSIVSTMFQIFVLGIH